MKDFPGDKPKDDIPFDRELKNNRRKAIKEKEFLRAHASRKMKSAGFWGVIAGVGFLTDLTFLGGCGTALMALSGVSWLNSKSGESQIKKEIKDIESKIMDIEELRALNPNAMTPDLQKQFSQAQEKIKSLQQEMDALKNSKRGIDKPKLD